MSKPHIRFLYRVLGMLTFSVLCLPPLWATHFMGGDVSFNCLGGNEYLLRFNIYRDCQGVPFDEFLYFNLVSQSCGTASTGSAELVSNYPRVITPLCDDEPDVCEDVQGTYGVEHYIYERVMEMPGVCPDYRISIMDCCRNSAISTVNQPNSEGYYIDAKLDMVTVPCNSSPVFNNEPIPFICVGQEANYNHGVTDPDGDELVFSLVDCQSEPGLPVAYTPPYNGALPLDASDVSIDPTTGSITLTANALQVGVLCVLVEEFRNGVKIGEVVRDMQFTVIECVGGTVADVNNLPSLSGMNGLATANGTTGEYSIALCYGLEYCFDVQSFDLDNDNLELLWNQGIGNGATFEVADNNSPWASAQFCWTPSLEDVGVNFFTVRIMDDACPVRGVNTYTYTVEVSNGFLNYDYVADSVSCYSGTDGTATLQILDILDDPVFSWQTNPPQYGLTASDLPAGLYQVFVQDDSLECDNTVLEINIPEPEPVKATKVDGVEVSCGGNSDGTLTVEITGGLPPYDIQWSNGATGLAITNLTAGAYTITMTDAEGCVGMDVFMVTEPPLLALDYMASDYNGYGISCKDGDDGFVDMMVSGGIPPYQYAWSNGGTGENLSDLEVGAYTLTISDSGACVDSITFLLGSPDSLSLAAASTPVTCYGDSDGTIEITNILGGLAPYSWSLDGEVFAQLPGTGIQLSNLSAGWHPVYTQDAQGCIAKLWVEVGGPPQPKVYITPQDTVVDLGEEVGLAFTTTLAEPYSFVWSSGVHELPCDSCASMTLLPLATGEVFLEVVEEEDGCAAAGVATIRLNQDVYVYIPNAFSPNGDGYNEHLTIFARPGTVTEVLSFDVFGRWGGQVYQRDNFPPNEPASGWDGTIKGKPAPAGVYIYTAELLFLNGVKRRVSGEVTLLR